MFTKQELMEQYKKIAAEKELGTDSTFGLSAQEVEIVKRAARDEYLRQNKTNSDIEYANLGAFNLGADTYKYILEETEPEIWGTATPDGFINVCAGMSDKEATPEDKAMADKLLDKTIENGVNLEAVKARAYAMKALYEKSGNKELANQMASVIGYCTENEMASPYYELKDHQKMINRYQDEAYKHPDKADFYRQKIAEREGQIADFLYNCDKQGLDPEIAQEYLESARKNLATEERLNTASRFKINEMAQPEATDSKAEPEYASRNREITPGQSNNQEESKVEEVSEEEIQAVKDANAEDFGVDLPPVIEHEPPEREEEREEIHQQQMGRGR